jgi:hypothetical protein
MFDDFQKDAFERARQPGTEKRVDDHVVGSAWLGDLFPRVDAFALDKRERRGSFG